MPYCPECEAEYEAGIAECTDCGCALVAELPPRDDEPHDLAAGEPVPLRSFANAAEASLVSNLLAENGVRAFVSGGEFTVAPSGFSDEIVLMVDERDLERARSLYEAFFGENASVDAETPTSEESEGGDQA